jgi:hypothetical protein
MSYFVELIILYTEMIKSEIIMTWIIARLTSIILVISCIEAKVSVSELVLAAKTLEVHTKIIRVINNKPFLAFFS